MPGWPQALGDFVMVRVSPAMVSLDGIHWHEKPDDVPMAQFLWDLAARS